MAKSYAGYVKRPTPINWGLVAGDIVNRMDNVEKEQEAFREKYDTLASDLIKETSKYEDVKNPKLEEILFNTTIAGKNLITDMHNKLKRREISPSQMGMLKNSISSEWSDFNNLVKNIDTGLNAALEGYEDGVNGKGTLWAIDQYNKLTQLKSSQPVWSPSDNGYAHLYMQKLDDKGDPVTGPGGLTSTRTLKNPNNLIFRDSKLNEKVAEFQKEIKTGIEYITENNITIADPKAKPEYDSAVKSLIEGIIGTEEKPLLKSAFSVLVDYGNYEPYGEGEAPPANGKGVLVSIGTDSEYVPEITKDLYDEAYQIALDRVNLTSPYKKIKRSTSSSSNSNQTKSQEAAIVYQQATAISRGDATAINDLINQDDTISDIQIIQIGSDMGIRRNIKETGIKIFDNDGKLKDFIPFVYEDEENGIIDHDKTGFRLSKYVSSKPDVSSQKKEFNDGRKKAGKVASGKSQSRIRSPKVSNLKTKYERKGKKFDAVELISKFPEETRLVKQIFKDLGLPEGVVNIMKIDTGDPSSNSTTITIGPTQYSISKSTRDQNNLLNVIADPDEVQQDIQRLIDDYNSMLGMETPVNQMQETDIIGIDPTKYNVA